MRTKSGMRWMIPVLAVMLTAAGVPADQTARVLGRVTDAAGNAVAGARVTLAEPGGGAARSTASGQTGGFEFTGVAPGTYTLRAEAGRSAREQRIVVGAETRLVTPVLRLGRG